MPTGSPQELELTIDFSVCHDDGLMIEPGQFPATGVILVLPPWADPEVWRSTPLEQRILALHHATDKDFDNALFLLFHTSGEA